MLWARSLRALGTLRIQSEVFGLRWCSGIKKPKKLVEFQYLKSVCNTFTYLTQCVFYPSISIEQHFSETSRPKSDFETSYGENPTFIPSFDQWIMKQSEGHGSYYFLGSQVSGRLTTWHQVGFSNSNSHQVRLGVVNRIHHHDYWVKILFQLNRRLWK